MKLLKTTFFVILLLFNFIAHISAQTVSHTGVNNISKCGDEETFQVKITHDAAVSGTISIILPAGTTATSPITTPYTITAGGSTVIFSYNLKANCDAVRGLVTTTAVITRTGSTAITRQFSFNIQEANLTVTTSAVRPPTLPPSQVYNWCINIVNNGLGYTNNFTLNFDGGSGCSSGAQIISVGGVVLPTPLSLPQTFLNLSVLGLTDGKLNTDETITLCLALTSGCNESCTDKLNLSWGCGDIICENDVLVESFYINDNKPIITVSTSKGRIPACGVSENITFSFTNTSLFTANNLNVTDYIWRSNQLGGSCSYTVSTPIGTKFPSGSTSPLTGITLLPGERIEVIMQIIYPETTAGCGLDKGRCDLVAEFSFESACGTQYEQEHLFDLNLTNMSGGTVGDLPPISAINGTPVLTKVCMSREMRNFDCPTDKMILVIDEVPGYTITPVTPTPAGYSFSHVSPKYYIEISSPIYGNPTNNLIELCVEFYVTLDCDAPGYTSFASIPYEFRYVCDADCGYEERQFCSALFFENELCPGTPTPYDCANIEFSLNRTTSGFTDNTLNTQISTLDPTLHRVDLAMPCDIVHLKTATLVDGGFNDARYEIDYTGSDVFEDAGNIIIATCTDNSGLNPPITVPVVAYFNPGASPRISYQLDLSAGAIPAGNWLVEIEADLRITKDIPPSCEPRRVLGLSGTLIKTRKSVTMNCGYLNNRFFTVKPPDEVLKVCNINIDTCDNVMLKIEMGRKDNCLIAGSNSPCYRSYFTNEFRQNNQKTSLVLDLPTGYGFGTGAIRYTNSTTGQTNVPLPSSLHTPTPLTGNTVTIDLDDPFFELSNVMENEYSFSIPVVLENCASAETPLNFNTSLNYVKYAYAEDALCRENSTLSLTNTIRIRGEALTAEVYPETSEWTGNDDFFSVTFAPNSDNTWIAFFDPNTPNSPQFDIIKVEKRCGGSYSSLMPTTTVIGLVTPTIYSMVNLGTLIESEGCKFQVYYKPKACNDIDIKMYYGMSCKTENAVSNPEAIGACVVRNEELFQSTLIATYEVQAAIDYDGSLSTFCDKLTYKILMKNADKQNLQNFVAELTLKSGMTYVNGTSELSVNSGTYTPINDPVISGSLLKWDIDAALNTVPPVILKGAEYGAEYMELKFDVLFSCDVDVDNTQTVAVITAEPLCGKGMESPPRAQTSVGSPPVSFPWGNELYNLKVDISSVGGLMVNDCKRDTIIVRLENLGGGATQGTDYFVMEIPNEFSYAGGMTVISGGSMVFPTPTSTPTTDIYQFQLPSGVPLGGVIEFSFLLKTKPPIPPSPNRLDCKAYIMKHSSYVVRKVLCTADPEEYCSEKTIDTSPIGSVPINANLPWLQLSELTFNTPFVYSGSWPATYTFNVANVGTVGTHAAGLTNVQAHFYCDSDFSGSFTTTDRPIFTHNITTNIPSGASIFQGATVTVPTTGGPLTFAEWVACRTRIIGVVAQNNPLNATYQCLCGANAILPINILGFDVKKGDENNKVTWTSTGEFDGDYYIVQRARDTEKPEREWEWDNLSDKIPANSKSSSYTFPIEPLYYNTCEYYRLKMVSGDSIYYSKLVKVCRDDIARDIFVYPNPANTTIAVILPDGEIVDIDLTDLLGRKMVSKKNQSGEVKFDIQSFPAGVYFFEIYTLEKKQVVKFIKE